MLELLLIGLTRFLVGGRAYWLGCAPEPRQRVYFANHTSNLDTVVLWAALPPELRQRTRPVAAADYWGHGRLRRAFGIGVLRAVLIDRATGGRAALDPLHAALAEGASLIIFPEGGRFPGPLPQPFKSGLYHLAQAHPDVELIPVWLENSGRALPKGASIPIPVSASAVFGAPLAPRPDEDRDAFLERARASLVALATRLTEERAHG
jgi:1-acyl-sn-glycerol-3-phosphate acyltransferase